MEIELREVTEGGTRLLVPQEVVLTKKSTVFYNPVMELNRDLSIAVCSLLKPESFCDLLSGSGARAVRAARETCTRVHANDINPCATELIRKNAELNGVDIEVSTIDGNLLLSDRMFDYIDIDPFGSPVRFLDSAIRALNRDGVLAVTATDTAALCGSSPRACQRKYDATPLRTDYYNELGLRILIGSIARAVCRHGKGAEVLFSHCTSHYFRTYLRLRRGVGKSAETLKRLGFLQHCFGCLYRSYSDLGSLLEHCPVCGRRLCNAGPQWIGEFADQSFSADLEKRINEMDLGTGKEAAIMVNLIGSEQAIKLPYYNVHKISSKMGVPSQTMETLRDSLEGAGYGFYRTHFERVGVRTDAPLPELRDIIANKVK